MPVIKLISHFQDTQKFLKENLPGRAGLGQIFS
jgi:hypothetical protein